MKRSSRTLAAVLIGVPFVISGAFWISPYLGWPGLLIGAVTWIGAFASLSDVTNV